MATPQPPTKVIPLEGLYQDWFLDYASYVILERAIPAIEDGLKFVQRRLLHAMYTMDDGRYSKVANIVGQTMQYHPHGDASIEDALVHLGQKGLLIDTQGNWGDMRTGDGAAAARYIEARLTPLAKALLYDPKVTHWKPTYDGRKEEPVTLPVKFPLLLAQGAEGIAVGLATKILPHNPTELLQGAIKLLQGGTPTLLPDFPLGGMADCSHYQDGKRGGKVVVRAHLVPRGDHTVAITSLPYGVTTPALIDSILKAQEKGKVKFKRITDNTAQVVEVVITTLPGMPLPTFVEALYRFTDCQVTLSPNACVIKEEKPFFGGVTDLLRYHVGHTQQLLEEGLRIRQAALRESIFKAQLEALFITKRLYQALATCTTWEEITTMLAQGLAPYVEKLYRPLKEEDLVHLTEMKVRRISQYDLEKGVAKRHKMEEELATTEHHLSHMVAYTIAHYQAILAKHGKEWKRKTTLTTIAPTQPLQAIAPKDEVLRIDYASGFAGYALPEGTAVGPCATVDQLIAFDKQGGCKVVPVAPKVFLGKNLYYVALFRKQDTRRVYNIVYLDGARKVVRAKRFVVQGIIRHKAYPLAGTHGDTQVLYLSDNANGEAEQVVLTCSPLVRTRTPKIIFDFATLAIKGRQAQGNIITRHPIKQVRFHAVGGSTLGSLALSYDATTGWVNDQGKGNALGTFAGEDTLLLIDCQGMATRLPWRADHHLDKRTTCYVAKHGAESALTLVYRQGNPATYIVKRCQLPTLPLGKAVRLLPAEAAATIVWAGSGAVTTLQMACRPTPKDTPQQVTYDLGTLAVKQPRAKGTKLPWAVVEIIEAVETSTPPS